MLPVAGGVWQIRANNDDGLYETVEAFRKDVAQILTNACAYETRSTEEGNTIISKAHAFVDDIDKYLYADWCEAKDFAERLAEHLVAAGQAPADAAASAAERVGASGGGHGVAEPFTFETAPKPVYRPPAGERMSRRLAGTVPEVPVQFANPRPVEYSRPRRAAAAAPAETAGMETAGSFAGEGGGLDSAEFRPDSGPASPVGPPLGNEVQTEEVALEAAAEVARAAAEAKRETAAMAAAAVAAKAAEETAAAAALAAAAADEPRTLSETDLGALVDTLVANTAAPGFTIKKLLHLSARVSGASAVHTLVTRIGSTRQLTVHAGVVWSQRHARDKRLVLQELQLIATCIPASFAV